MSIRGLFARSTSLEPLCGQPGIDSVLAKVSASGMTALFMQAHSGGGAPGTFYTSPYYPMMAYVEPGFDPFAYAIEAGAALEEPVDVYAWMCLGAEVDLIGPQWDVAQIGAPVSCLNWSIAAARQRVADMNGAFVEQYPDAAGIVWDYCRYEWWSSMLEPQYGLSLNDVTQAVQLARSQMGSKKFLASVYANVTGGREDVLQDWLTWLAQGYIDLALPMCTHASRFVADLATWPSQHRSKIAPILYTCLLSESYEESQKTPAQLQSDLTFFEGKGLSVSRTFWENWWLSPEQRAMLAQWFASESTDEQAIADLVASLATIFETVDTIEEKVSILRG